VITPGLIDKAKILPDHPWFAEHAPPVILGVGRLEAVKDFSTLLRAFALVRSQKPARLLILGEGEQRILLENLARELNIEQDVRIPGYVADSISYMKRCSVFVLSSLYEGLPGAMIEALASGCQVISTDCPGGAREILGNGEYGDLVPVGNPEAMAHAICEILGGKYRNVDRKWLEQFELNHVTDQTLKTIGLPEFLQ
jgi:glycosyltransferase involved in cell wall biosynthesis